MIRSSINILPSIKESATTETKTIEVRYAASKSKDLTSYIVKSFGPTGISIVIPAGTYITNIDINVLKVFNGTVSMKYSDKTDVVKPEYLDFSVVGVITTPVMKLFDAQSSINISSNGTTGKAIISILKGKIQ